MYNKIDFYSTLLFLFKLKKLTQLPKSTSVTNYAYLQAYHEHNNKFNIYDIAGSAPNSISPTSSISFSFII